MLDDIVVGPFQISFDITNKCNLRCLHCYNSSGENFQSQDELSDEEVLKFIDDLKDIKLYNFCFCGGETLLRKDLIIEATKRLKAYGCENVAMVSNGILMDEDTIQQLINAGINRIQISIDGFKPESHDRLRNKKGVHEISTKALKNLAKYGVNTGVAFTPTSFNITEIEDLHNYLHDIGIKGSNLRVQPLMIIGRASQNEQNILANNEQYRQLVSKINEINATNKEPRIEWGDPVDHLIRYRKKNLMMTNMVIRSNGELIADPYLPIVFGNLRKHSIIDYWKSGLNSIWNSEIVKKINEKIICMSEMDMQTNELPEVFKHGDVYVDIIDDDFNAVSQKLINSFSQ